MDPSPFNYIPRVFKQIKPVMEGFSTKEEKPIEAYFDNHIFVVLGEPGLGKTTSFRCAAESESDAVFVRISEFLNSSAHSLKGKTLYLDGLDEQRRSVNNTDIMDAIAGRLKDLGNPKVRISCRTSEWHGERDLSKLSTISSGTPVVQLELQPLKVEDIDVLLPGNEDFVKGARENNLGEFLSNPQDFFLLYEFYHEKDKWPDSRSELMEGSCRALLKETNREHYEASDDLVTDRDLTQASDYLASILMLSNVTGISSVRTTANKSFPAIHEFHGNLFAMNVATSRRVFKKAENKRIEPKHRKIAEYMAARYLAKRVREGLSLRRVMALMTSADGGITSDLKGVYAWLVTMLAGMADYLLSYDPLGAIIYGDTRAWTPNTKKMAIDALENLSMKDPWFRGQEWQGNGIGGLSDPALVEYFQSLILRDDCNPHLLLTIFDAIADGSELPKIGDSLLDFVRNKENSKFLRERAIKAFEAACPERKSELIKLLDDIQNGGVSDTDQTLRGVLLNLLYPQSIGPERIIDYLIEPSDNFIGGYYVFLNLTLFDVTNRESLHRIAVSLRGKMKTFMGKDDYQRNNFISSLITTLVEGYGSEATTDQLYLWLSLGIGDHGNSILQYQDAEAIQKFLGDQDQIYIDLFSLFSNEHLTDSSNGLQVWYRFWHFTANTVPPRQFPKILVGLLNDESDPSKACKLFEIVCQLVMNTDKPSLSSVSMVELEELSKRRPEFKDEQEDGILKRFSVCKVEEWRQKDAAYKRQQLEEQRIRVVQNVETLTPHKLDVESGQATSYLEFYARVWFGRFTDVDTNASPLERLQNEVGYELAESLLEGFRKALFKPVFNSFQEIAELKSKSKCFYRGFLMLAGMDLFEIDGKEAVLNLPDDILKLALAYEMSTSVSKPLKWKKWLLTEKMELVANVINEYWRVQFSAEDAVHVPNFYVLNVNDPLILIVQKILPNLLTDFPKLRPELLNVLLTNAARFCSFNDLEPIIDKALRKRFKERDQRTMWVSLGFFVNQNKYFKHLKRELRRPDAKWAAYSILMIDLFNRGEDGIIIRSIQYRELLVKLLGKLFDNVSFRKRGEQIIGERDEETVAHNINEVIQAFSEDPSNEAAESLNRLKEDPDLTRWHTEIMFSMAKQIKTAREDKYTYPDVSQVVSTLADAEPANVTDLKALIMDILKEVADEMRHGNTDGYKAFWNTDRYGMAKKNEHVDENTARDRLLDLLRPKLRHLDIVAEPEASYADDKRADIAIYCRGMKLPIEIKRDDHSDIWTAADRQLNKLYSRDPAAEGNGIYLVFWLDGLEMKRHPKGFRTPKQPKELTSLLQNDIPESSNGLIDILVIDASIPKNKVAKN